MKELPSPSRLVSIQHRQACLLVNLVAINTVSYSRHWEWEDCRSRQLGRGNGLQRSGTVDALQAPRTTVQVPKHFVSTVYFARMGFSVGITKSCGGALNGLYGTFLALCGHCAGREPCAAISKQPMRWRWSPDTRVVGSNQHQETLHSVTQELQRTAE